MLGLCSSDSAIASVFLRDVDPQPGFCIGPEKFIIIREACFFQHLQGTGILFRRTRRLYRSSYYPPTPSPSAALQTIITADIATASKRTNTLFFHFTLSFYFLLSAISPYLWKMYCEGNGFLHAFKHFQQRMHSIVLGVWYTGRSIGKAPLACLAAGTFSLIHFKPVQGDGIKQAVDGSQRTQIAAKRTIYPLWPTPQQHGDQNLPAKQKTKPGSE